MAEKPEEKQVDEPKEQSEEKSSFAGKYTQFAATTADEYIQKLEDAYAASSQEGQRLHGSLTEKEQEIEVIKKLVQSDPDLKNKMSEKLYEGSEDLFDDEGRLNKAVLMDTLKTVIRDELPKQIADTPALKRIEEEKRAQDKVIYDEFVKNHPEITDNSQLQEDLNANFGIVASSMAQKGTVDFAKALNKAWQMTGGSEDAELKGMEKMAQKESAAMSSPTSGASKPSKKELTEAESRIASLMGLTAEQYLEGKVLSEKSKENY